MGSVELIDVLDEDGNKTGKQKTIGEIHEDGDWHTAVHVWIMNSQGELLIQHRSSTHRHKPNMWDISVGGHVSAGKDVLSTAVLETYEELGIQLARDDFEHLFTVRQESINEETNYINREINPVYLVRKDIPRSDFRFIDGEVSDVIYVTPEALREMLKDQNTRIIQHPKEYQKLFEYLKERI